MVLLLLLVRWSRKRCLLLATRELAFGTRHFDRRKKKLYCPSGI